MFDMSFAELFVLASAALIVLGPKRLPGALRAVGLWIARARRLVTTLGAQSGITQMIRSDGMGAPVNQVRPSTPGEPLTSGTGYAVPDKSREYPVEGPDAGQALPEDLLPVPVVPALHRG